MNDAQHGIFRADAFERFARTREGSVLPRFVAPPTFGFLWSLLGLLLGLLLLGGSVAWFGPPVLSRLLEPASLGEATGHESAVLVQPTDVASIEPRPETPAAPTALPSLGPPASVPAPAAAFAAPTAAPAGAAPKSGVPVMPMGAPTPQDKVPSVPVMPMGAAVPAPSDATARNPTSTVRTVGR
jgi:hypothetical protein